MISSVYSDNSFISIIIGLVIAAYTIVVWWILLEKSGDEGWKLFVPIYGSYCKCKSVDSIPLFWGGLAFAIADKIITELIQEHAYFGSVGIAYAILAIEVIVSLYLHVRFSMNTAKAFNKSGGFTAGLIFLPHIFLSILAFGKSKHKNQIENAEEEANFQEQI